jgi:hypothetical protein
VNNDPFYDPPEDQIIGTANIFLEPLSYLMSIRDPFPIIDYKVRLADAVALVVVAPLPCIHVLCSLRFILV